MDQTEVALNVVVYPAPGPDGDIEEHARAFMNRKALSGTDGGLGYLVLVKADFDRIWDGLNKGDALGTAAAVLHHVGGNAHQFIGRTDDFMFGWVGDEDPKQVVARPHLVAARRAQMN